MTEKADEKSEVEGNELNKDELPKGESDDGHAEPDAVAKLAMELGWNPEFTGPNAVDAKTFILRSREINDGLSKSVRGLRKELSAMREGIEAVRWSTEQAGKKEITRLQNEIRDLKTQRKEALRGGQIDNIESLDIQIESKQDALRTAETTKPPAPAPTVNPAWTEWVAENKWYNADPELKEYADALSGMADYRALPFEQCLNRIGQAVRKMYPEKFKQGADKAGVSRETDKHAGAAAPVASASHRGAKPKGQKTKATAADLTYEQTNIAKEMVALGVYKNTDEYAQALADKASSKGGAA